MSNSRFILSALGKHGKRFVNEDWSYGVSSVKEGLDKINSSQSAIKSVAISEFNIIHTGGKGCPFKGDFNGDPETGYAKALHLGTTRIWNADGSINEERWKKFEDYVTAGQNADGIRKVTLSKVKEYLKYCLENDPQEQNTGRNTNSIFSSKFMQGRAAVAGWGEVFDRLTCGYVEDKEKNLDPYITLDIIREFFEDSEKALQKAEEKSLPVPKPQVTNSYRM